MTTRELADSLVHAIRELSRARGERDMWKYIANETLDQMHRVVLERDRLKARLYRMLDAAREARRSKTAA
jgi:hypothetical protein